MNSDTVNGVGPVHLESPTDESKAWEKKVWARNRSRCSNCGQTERLRVKMVVPLEAGGQLVEENGVLLCRSCDMATDTVARSDSGADQRLVNFWVSKRLFDRIQFGIENYKAFTSMGGLVRYLISKYVQDEPRFDDLALYQDEAQAVKINVWVEKDRYNTFKVLIDKRGMTVTDAIKSLILMYEMQAEVLIAPRSGTPKVGEGDV